MSYSKCCSAQIRTNIHSHQIDRKLSKWCQDFPKRLLCMKRVMIMEEARQVGLDCDVRHLVLPTPQKFAVKMYMYV